MEDSKRHCSTRKQFPDVIYHSLPLKYDLGESWKQFSFQNTFSSIFTVWWSVFSSRWENIFLSWIGKRKFHSHQGYSGKVQTMFSACLDDHPSESSSFSFPVESKKNTGMCFLGSGRFFDFMTMNTQRQRKNKKVKRGLFLHNLSQFVRDKLTDISRHHCVPIQISPQDLVREEKRNSYNQELLGHLSFLFYRWTRDTINSRSIASLFSVPCSEEVEECRDLSADKFLSCHTNEIPSDECCICGASEVPCLQWKECQHHFCTQCLNSWMKQTIFNGFVSCPLCNKQYSIEI